MERKEPMTKGSKLMFEVAKIILIAQWIATTLGLFVLKDFPAWLFRPIGWVYWVLGCLALAGYLLTKLGLGDEYKG